MQARKVYRGAEVYLHLFLTSVRNGGEWSASRCGHFTLGAIAQLTCWIGFWVISRANLDLFVKFSPLQCKLSLWISAIWSKLISAKTLTLKVQKYALRDRSLGSTSMILCTAQWLVYLSSILELVQREALSILTRRWADRYWGSHGGGCEGTVFWDVTSDTWVASYQGIGRHYCRRLQGRR